MVVDRHVYAWGCGLHPIGDFCVAGPVTVFGERYHCVRDVVVIILFDIDNCSGNFCNLINGETDLCPVVVGSISVDDRNDSKVIDYR